MKSTRYSNFCLRLFGRFFKDYKKEELEEKNLIFVKANIPMSYEEYYSTTIMTILLGSIISIILSVLFYHLIQQFIQNEYLLIIFFLIPIIVTLSIAGFYMYYPTYCVNRRGRDIDLFIPYAINFISSMAVAGISPAEIFQTLSKVEVYGEVQTEAKKITKEIEIMGTDNISALKHAIEFSPSRKFKSFIQGIIGTIQAGSDLHAFLGNIAKKYMDDDLIARKKDLDLLAVLAEVLVLSVIAFPIFLVIIVTVMGFFGGSMKLSLTLLLFFSFIVLPLIYAMFYLLIKSTSIEKIGKIVMKRLTLKEHYEAYKPSWLIIITSLISIVFLYSLIQVFNYLGYISLGTYFFWDFMFLALLIFMGPIGLFSYFEVKKKKQMQERLPDFLIEIGDSMATGMTVFDAVKTAQKGNYGRLNPEIDTIKNQLSWRVSMKDALYDFADRMKTAIVKRIVIVLDRGLMMGGNTHKIFKAAAGEVEQVNQLELQRKAVMVVYALVILVCFFVFLGIIMILDSTIFAEFLSIQEKQMLVATPVATGALKLTVVDPVLLSYTLYSFVFVQSIGAGLLAGFMVDGKLVSGVRFSCLLGIITIFVFKILL